MGNRSLRRLLVWVGLLLAGPLAAGAADLANAQLLIAGSQLTVSPESQTVPFDTPTIVDTHLVGYDVSRGMLPADLRVVGDFTGPEVSGVLVLETVPNQPFRIPRLRLEGDYRLDNIRLMQGPNLLAYAQPRSAAVKVTQVLITKVTSRALTLDEIRSYGIVVNSDSFQAFNFTFAFAVAGETVNYNIPVIYMGAGKDPYILWGGPTNFDSPAWQSSSVRFEPPRMAPFQLSFANNNTGDPSNGGCDAPDGDCSTSTAVPIPGVILFPTDVSLLHQFFSVMLMAQNGAPAGDRLEIHDLTAKITLPPGLRQAQTTPPTPLGVPVPVRVPGPDGILGTADDLTFLVAQSSGQAEVLVEGLREGTHIVQFDLEGVLHGMADGQLRRVTGTAKGAVIVRDPTLSITITHPDVVRTDEEYSLLLTVTNTGTAPANLLKVELPLDQLTGVEVVGDNAKTVTVLPGDAELLEFRLRSKRTGRVVATAVRSSTEISPTFDLTVGVGENGIPLSPSSIILPSATDVLPPDLVRSGLNLIGLGFSLATAPPSLLTNLPRVSRSMVDSRVYQLSQTGRQVSFGEDLFDSAAELAAEWTGSRDGDWEWDLLRRTTQKGAHVGATMGAIFAAEAAASGPAQAFERFAKTTGYLPPLQGALAIGDGITLEIASRLGGQRLRGGGDDTTRLRELPFADLYTLSGSAQMAVMVVPEPDGYEARLRASVAAPASLHLVVPAADGTLRLVTWDGVTLAAGGAAVAAFRTADSSFVLQVDTDGNGTVDYQLPGAVSTLQRRPFQALAAVLNTEVDPTGHVVEVLFTSDVDPASLSPADPRHFTIGGKVSNGGWVQADEDVRDSSGNTIANPFKGMRNSRIVRVVFNNPLSPYTPQDLAVSGVKNPVGETAVPTTLRVSIPSNAMPGILVHGKVYGPDGQPVPFADVELRETDRCLFCIDECSTHKTAVVRSDSTGSFSFDYVRQTDCSDIYQLTGIDTNTGRSGTATGRVRFIGQVAQLNVLMLGRGTIRGRVTYDDGTVPAAAQVIAESPVFREGTSAKPDANGNYSLSDVAVGTITLSASDGLGHFVVKTVAVAEAGSIVTFDLVILRHPVQPVANGSVRGVIFRPDGTTPVAGAYVALYTDGNLIGTRRSGADGSFDFGPVPAGRGEIDTFENETGQSGVQVFFTINPDQVNQVNLIMQNQRGTVEGFVYKVVNGANVPMFGVIVWAEGTPFKTATDAQGHYVLEGVFAGTRNISAADLDKQVKLSAAVTIGVEGQVVDKNFYFQDAAVLGGIAGEVLDFDGGAVTGATVHLAADDQHWYRTATTDSSGRFTLPNLGVGSYGVHAFKGANGGSTGAVVRFVGDTPFVSIRFKKGSIHGVVQAENDSGQPVGITALVTYRTTAVRLELVGLDLADHTLTTNPDGTWEIPSALVGPYVITVSNSFYGAKTVRGELVNNGESQTQNVLFERNTTGTIKGQVLDQDGVTPVAGAHVELKHPTLYNDMLTNADGRFSFALVPPTPWGFPVDVTWQSGVIFRKAEAWVSFSQKGQELDLEIVLPKQGSFSGRVADADGNLVPGSVVTLHEGSYPNRTLIANADAGGNFEFHNIFAGTITLSARAPSLGGLGGKTTVTLATDGEEVAGVTISLQPTGKIQGRITNPVDGSPAASAQVQLLRGGLFDSIDSDADGNFEFDLLPFAIYSVQALDPRTGRHGRRDGLQINQNDQIVNGDFQLETRGAVNGHLYEPGTVVAIPAATVRLSSQGLVGFATYSSTGVDGYFEFLGIPQGRFTLFSREPGGRRVANGQGEIVSEGQVVSQDIFLERQGTVIGSVLNPLGSPDGIFPNANTVLVQGGLNIGATLDSTYTFPGVILGHPFLVQTQEVGGPHQGETFGSLTDEGPVQIDVRIHPIGSVVVNVRDSFGNPVNAASVEVINSGFYGGKRLLGDTGTGNSITFQGVGEGQVTAYATNPVTGLRGSASSTLAQEGQIVQINLALENSAQIHGTVVLADGTTPAVNALVALQTGSRTLTTFTDATGLFSLPSVPMGSYLLVFQESFGPGTREIRGSLSVNGQILDLGTVVLDAVSPQVADVTPANGAVNLPLNTQPVVRFSEAMDTTRNLIDNTVHIETANGQWVSAHDTWIDGNTAIRIVPSAPLQNFTTYRIKVGSDLYDVAGRRLDQGVQVSFVTADVLPPVVIQVTPANNAKQVALDSQLQVMFNEPVDPSSLSGTHLLLTDVTAGVGVTTTFQLDAAARTVTVNPVTALIDGHAYQLTLAGVADLVGNATTTPFVTTFYTVDTTPPVISNVLPAEGATFTSGDRMTVSATVVDPAGVTSVTLSTGRWVLPDVQSPYSWSVPVPVVAAPTDVALQIEAVDTWGNHVASVRTIHVLPRTNTNPPQVTIGCLAHQMVPGAELDVPLHVTDDERIESYKLSVNGTTLTEVVLADAADVTVAQTWTVPATAAVGDTFTLHLEARDFAGNVATTDSAVSVIAGVALKGDRTLTDLYAGQTVFLSKGTVTVAGPLHVAGLILQGATLKSTTGGQVNLIATGRVEIACGSAIDVSGLGYAAGNASHLAGYAPDGVTASQPPSSGGSHGGRGGQTGAGEVYDSVYAPSQSGGGGAVPNGINPGGSGGGVVHIEAGEVALAGQILAKGKTITCWGGSGAGGAVSIAAGVVSGAGSIDTSGADNCNPSLFAGGGGRVSIVTGTWNGFDPVAQVKAWGGGNNNNTAYAAPGTIFYKKTGDTYGALLVDAGEVNGVDRVSLATELPVLGSGSVTGTAVAGADLWLSAGSGFAAKWLGVWVHLLDASGADLGAFPVAMIDGAGRLRLAGAAGVTGAASYRGEYRFDSLDLIHGAGLQATDPIVGPELVLEGNAEVSGQITAADVLVKSGAVVRPASGGELRIITPGRLTIEAGARLDVSGLGYAGGTASHLAGYAPDGVTASQPPSSGGSHGGRGGQAGAGEVFDSVYAPGQAGGGGAGFNSLSLGSLGGGVVHIEAGEVALAGQIVAKGTGVACYGGSGAGGTVSIAAGVMGGAGSIDASGADTCNSVLYAGGGGRVSIVTGTWSGFDPVAQVKAWGGGNNNGTTYAAPGTIFYKKTGDTYGALLVDAGEVNGVDRASLVTNLPVLGSGSVTGTAVAGADLWLSAVSGFAAKWLGVWVHLLDAGGADLGAFPVAMIDGAGRLRLAGAAAVTGAVTYQGEYRFDRIDFNNGAGLQATDPIVGPELVLEGNAEVSGQITAANVLVKSGAVVRPAAGGELRITTPGRLTLEAGAVLDVSGLGYAAGSASHLAGYAPDGVTGSQPPSSGGSHGGRGGQTGAGEVFDSVYTPSQSGGGGAVPNGINPGGSGGGVVHIEAGEVLLAGQILAKGTKLSCGGGSGAGGTVSIVAGVVSGTGSIDASGADTCNSVLVAGGGGRVSIVTGTWNGFDPLSQVKAWGGGNNNGTTYAAPGTVFYKQTSDTYGALLVDAGEAGGVDRVSLATQLPVLGTGQVTAVEVSGGDLWVSSGPGFLLKWAGAWMRLRGAAGEDLGVYSVAGIDAAGRARLTAAAGVTGAATYRGEYRFDRVELKNGGGVDAQDALTSTDTVFDSGDAELAGEVTGATARVLSGAVVRPARGSDLRLTLTGKLTVETGARLDVTGQGYAAGNASHLAGYAPDGVTGSQPPASGGSHGGRGGQTGAGEVFDSVFAPGQAGGGGAVPNGINPGGSGGGVVHIEAGEVALAGQIVAKGTSISCGGGSGAGGTVSIVAGVVSGAGSIDASGADTCNSVLVAGGGGRVSIVTGTWNGFDPLSQVKAWGGGNNTGTAYAAPGTIFYKQTGDTYGALLVDAGEVANVDRVSLATELPVLGTGPVTAAEVSGGDLWVSTGSGFLPKWAGAWMRLRSATGADLGAYSVAGIDAAGRARLTAAASVTGAATYQGEYRFDRVELKNGGGVDAKDPLTSTDTVFDSGDAELAGEVTGATARVLSGAVVRPARGSDLRLTLTGKLTVETGARLDVTGQGYAAGNASHLAGYAPDGVTGSQPPSSGGSHGGRGGQAGAGEVFDSVYAPGRAGGGGAVPNGINPGGSGGGVVHIEAGEVALAGQIVAKGTSITCGGGSGAGGTVSIVAGAVSGAGSIDASGADTCNSALFAGSGGRVAIVTGTWNGFDPSVQVKAWGGANSNGTLFAAPGTVFYRKTGDTYGSLLVDQGAASGTVGTTTLSSIGKGIVGAVYAEPANATAQWFEPQDTARKFDLGVIGLWVRINGTDYAVIAQSDDRRRLLLAGAAGTVSVGDAYLGIYKLDAVTVKGRATLQLADGAVIGSQTIASGSTLVLFDLMPPSVTITQPAAGAVYASGQTIQIAATATDDRAVASVTFRLGDQSSTFTAAPYTWTPVAPPVTAEGDLAITVEAVDTNDNHTTATRSIHLQPLAPTNPPAVSFLYPGAGALLPVGTGLDVQLQATDDHGVQRVELSFGGGAPVAVLTAAPYTAHLSAPAGAVDGQILNLQATAYDFSRQSATATIPVRIVQGTVLTQSQTLAAADTSLDGTTVVVSAGTLTVTGPHTFRDLVVLSGAKVTHPATTAAQENHLDLTLQRDLFVASGGAIDATGRGYLGAPSSSQRAYGYGNVQTEGANAGIGGSHGGRGGAFDGSSPIYGSFYDPADPGAGGGAAGSSRGQNGGGVVRLTVSGNAVIDGSVAAGGEAGSFGAGGAGGSIRLNASSIQGVGSLQASGATGGGGTSGGGSGGRIALYATTIDSGLISRTLAAGGKTSASNPAAWGAAGTVFVKPDSQAFGDLYLDNAGTASAQLTELLPVGSGIVDAVASGGFTDNEADFRHVLGAADVVFNGNFGAPYPITGNSHHGTTLTLQVPAPPLSAVVHAGDSYQGLYRFNRVIIRNGAQGIARDTVTLASPNVPEVSTGSTWSPGYAQSIQIASPAAGASYTSGASIPAAVSVQDALGVQSVTWSFGSQSSVATGAPYSWSAIAPEVTQGTDFQLSATATDLSGNRFTATRTVHVDPVVDPNAPVVTLTSCYASGAPGNCVNPGDLVAPGVAVAIPFTAVDDNAIQSYSLIVDGTTVQTVGSLNQASVAASVTWTPPANSALGTSFSLRIEARDFSGKIGFTTLTLAVPAQTALTGNQNLTSSLNGQSVVLGGGTFTVQQPLSLASLLLLNGAKVVGLTGQALSLTTTGTLQIQYGGSLDVSALGYAGGATTNSPGGAPSGVTASAYDAGGSHGGMGALGLYTGPAGDIYDSVYQPQLGGGGGSLKSAGTGVRGGNGGGVLTLNVGQLVLNGQIWAKGEQRATLGNTDSSGAGGTVVITAGVLSGAGSIDASGGTYDNWNNWGGSGGGGRVALYSGTLSGFDPVSQVKTWGGTLSSGPAAGPTTVVRYAGPGTIFVKTAADTYGRLIVDSGKETSGAERVGPQTLLPSLGTGTVTAFQAQGADALVTAGAAFKVQWLGARMALMDSTGAPLGSFQVQSIDGSGRVSLKGAGAVTGAVQYRGQYRFDRLDVKGGAGVTSSDDVIVGDVYAESKGRLPSTLTATNVTIKAGASPVTLAQGSTLSLTVSGTLTVESGAVLDVSALGYAGGATTNSPGGAPSGVTASGYDAGGSHGGSGSLGTYTGPIGDIFDSVYQPQLGGGGGSLRSAGTGLRGGNGGGVLTLNVGQLVLNGQIWAKGEQRATLGNTDSSGAGGSVVVTAGVLSGTGSIDVSGGTYDNWNNWGGSGGGGRVALYAGILSGFDPVSQVKTWGGTLSSGPAAGPTTVVRYAGPGTIFVKTAADTYGRLIVDSGKETSGAERVGPQTLLPSLGTGTVTAFQIQGADALVTAGAAFKAQWLGAWMALASSTGAPLGSYLVQSIDGSGRASLKGAGGVIGAVQYRGQYRFDRLDVKSGAGVTSSDDVIVGDVYAESKGRLPSTLTATNVTIKAGASPVTLAQGSTLSLTVSGTLTVESGAVLDVSALGYAGGATTNSPGGAPSGVTASAYDAGGSHGGLGSLGSYTGPIGDIFDSVYQPQLGGGGGSLRSAATGRRGGNGGGVLTLNVGQLVLNGQIWALGEQRAALGNTDSSGAGGSVVITTGVLSGTGSIDASGGTYDNWNNWGGSGGGGRVALYAGTLSGFDPVSQVKTWGGTLSNGLAAGPTTVVRYAGPGTIFVKTAADTYGRLIVDSGKETSGAERVGPQTLLPSLGTGTVTAFQAQGADALVTAGAAFKAQWLGAWMALASSTGAPLGSYLVQSIDGSGRASLKGAGTVTGAVQYRGQYRFDRLDVKGGAGVTSSDDVIVGDVYAESKGRLPSTLTATNVTIKAGASPVTLAQGSTLSLTVSGTLTVESGAVLDVSALGYAGGATTNSPGGAPSGVTASGYDAGGSHGGAGSLGAYTGPVGDIFDSVYQPQLGGGGGSLRSAGTGLRGGNGGGVLTLNVGQLVLNGQIWAKGEQRVALGNTDSSGAGGTVVVTADGLSGAGSIDVSGGTYDNWNNWGGSGGGGRVALYVSSLSGFDPASQVKAWGGTLSNGLAAGPTTVVRYGSPGTLFVKLPSQTYGKLYVDQGGIVAGKTIPNTTLPAIGVGSVGTATADAVNTTALWIAPADSTAKFALGVVGMWVRVSGTDYRVIDQTADRRQLLLAGAVGAVSVGNAYRGVYKFDEVIVRGGSKLEFRDTNAVGTFTVDATSSVIQNVP